MVKHEHSLLPYRFGERDLNVLLRNWRRLGVGTEGRNCRQPSACLAYDPSIPSLLPIPLYLLYQALIQTRFVNIDVLLLSLLCVTQLQLPNPLFSLCLLLAIQPVPYPSRSSLLFALSPDRRLAAIFLQLRGNRLDGSFSLTRITGEVSLPGSRRVINSFGSSSHGRILSNPALNGYVFPPLSRGERSHDKFQRSR